jgi:hypothetical protein
LVEICAGVNAKGRSAAPQMITPLANPLYQCSLPKQAAKLGDEFET